MQSLIAHSPFGRRRRCRDPTKPPRGPRRSHPREPPRAPRYRARTPPRRGCQWSAARSWRTFRRRETSR